MKLLNKISLIVVGALMALATLMSAHAYVYPVEYGQPRIGAYTSTFPSAQGMYDYLSPPVALTRYGADYHLSNIRQAVYPRYPVTYIPNMHRPYYGYPYGFGSPNIHWRSSRIYNGGGGFTPLPNQYP